MELACSNKSLNVTIPPYYSTKKNEHSVMNAKRLFKKKKKKKKRRGQCASNINLKLLYLKIAVLLCEYLVATS